MVDYLLFQRRAEQFEQEELLALVGAKVVQGEDDGLHEFRRLGLRHGEDEFGEVGGRRLQEVEEALVRVQLLATLLPQRLQAVLKDKTVK